MHNKIGFIIRSKLFRLAEYRLGIRKFRVFHVSWLIAWGCFGLLIGTFLSLYSLSFIGIEWVVVSLCLIIVGLSKRNIFGVMMILTAGMLIGLRRGGNLLKNQNEFQQYFGKNVVVTGKVSEDPSYDIDGDLKFKLSNVLIGDTEISGQLWAGSSTKVELKRSDTVEIEGQITEGFGNIPAAIFRAKIVKINRQDYEDFARDVRDSFAGGIRESITEPQASLGAGFLLGQKTALPEKLDQQLRLLSLTHIVVASGYNLTILIRFARRFFEKLSRFTALAFSGGLVYMFALMTGWNPSMVRAGIIAGLSLLAWYYGRKFHPVVLLSISAAVTVLINPSYAWGDIGWLLSYTSFIGVIVLSPLIHAYFWGEKKPGSVRQVFMETLSAQLLTLPIIAHIFGQYSPLALISNVLVLPLIPIAMLFTFIAGISGVLLPTGLSIVIGWPAQMLIGYMTTVIDWLSQSSYAGRELNFNLTAVIVSYIIIFVMIIYLLRRTGHKLRSYNIIE